MVQQLEGEGMEGQVNILKKHTTVCRGRDELMKESTDSFKGDSYTRGSPPLPFLPQLLPSSFVFCSFKEVTNDSVLLVMKIHPT